ncbi:hypothetical protein NDU88_013140 [Pleurodeles waltl]|uniref:Uncharacterized protein n=1 Tax=Pleurodeles waltl TaxID=8319 RepID=A0AAV7R591_PLEWA|nr:hypothetical protein NDU88_013140 [Pleurodeles waltl]
MSGEYCEYKEIGEYCECKDSGEYCECRMMGEYCAYKESDEYCECKESGEYCECRMSGEYCECRMIGKYCEFKESDVYCECRMSGEYSEYKEISEYCDCKDSGEYCKCRVSTRRVVCIASPRFFLVASGCLTQQAVAKKQKRLSRLGLHEDAGGGAEYRTSKNKECETQEHGDMERGSLEVSTSEYMCAAFLPRRTGLRVL